MLQADSEVALIKKKMQLSRLVMEYVKSMSSYSQVILRATRNVSSIIRAMVNAEIPSAT